MRRGRDGALEALRAELSQCAASPATARYVAESPVTAEEVRPPWVGDTAHPAVPSQQREHGRPACRGPAPDAGGLSEAGARRAEARAAVAREQRIPVRVTSRPRASSSVL
jgi:hypothetical protein